MVRRQLEIEAYRLQDLMHDLLNPIEDPRVFLKMDTQGYDLQVFAGLGEWADRIIGLQSELAVIPLYKGMPRWTEALAEYESCGFELACLAPVSRDPKTSRVLEFDCLMIRPERALHQLDASACSPPWPKYSSDVASCVNNCSANRITI